MGYGNLAKRVIQHSVLKPEKVEDYIALHAQPWPELIELLQRCNIHHYSISIRGTEVFTYYEYTGADYQKDMEILDADPIMQKWWIYSKPCFAGHENGHYYDPMEEVFYCP